MGGCAIIPVGEYFRRELATSDMRVRPLWFSL